jgi:hypothetical protein
MARPPHHDLWVRLTELKGKAVAAMASVPQTRSPGQASCPTLTAQAVDPARRVGRDCLTGFRRAFYDCLWARADELFELTDALLCSEGPVRSLVDLSLAPEHRRGHGGLYDGLNHGGIDVARLRRTLAGLPLPRVGGRIVLAVDVSPWLRPDAETSAGRLFCHVHGRARNTAQMIPGWPYSLVAALQSGRSSWTAVLDAVRLGPADDATAVTATQLRDVVRRLIEAGHWRDGDPDIVVVMDSGYDVTRLAFVLADLPVQLIGRLRSDRVLLRPVPERRPGTPGARAGTVRSWLWATRPPGPPPATPPAPRPPGTAPPKRPPGTGCTPGWPAADPGPATTVNCRSSKGP